MSMPPQVALAAFEIMTTVTGVAAAAGQAAGQSEVNQIAKTSEMQSRDANYDQLNLMAQQEQASAEQQIRQSDTEALQATARAEVAAAEAGVSGLSVDALINDMWGRNAQFTDNVNQNLENTNQQIAFELGNASRSYNSSVNSLPVPEQPNYMAAALSAGSSFYRGIKGPLEV